MGAAIYAFGSMFALVLGAIVAAVSGHFGWAVVLVLIGIPLIAAPWFLEAHRGATSAPVETGASGLRGSTVALFAVFTVVAIAFGVWLTK